MGGRLSKLTSRKFPWTSAGPTVAPNAPTNQLILCNYTHLEDCRLRAHDSHIVLSPVAQSLYAATLQNSSDKVEMMIEDGVDINMPLNPKRETALIVAVQLGNVEVVESLLRAPTVNLHCYNAHCCSVLDIAMIKAFDSRSGQQCDIYWKIICKLMTHEVEPLSKDAMTYILRTALKEANDDFINRFITAASRNSSSIKLHLYFLEKLHRQQPIYPGNMDDILQSATSYTIHLLCCANEFMLRSIVHSLIYYIESHWQCKKLKIEMFAMLVVVSTGGGWVWTTQQLQHIEKVHPDLAFWCCNQRFTPKSLSHLCRVTYRTHVHCDVNRSFTRLPFTLPATIRRYILLHDLNTVPHDVMSIQL